MKRFKVGDEIEWKQAKAHYKARVTKLVDKGFYANIYFPYEIKGYCWVESISLGICPWTLQCSPEERIIRKVKELYERQPYVKRIKQHSDKADSLSGVS